MEERLMGILRRKPGQAHPLDALLLEAGVPTKKAKEAKRALKSLVRRGLVERERGRRYRLSRAGQTIEGLIEFDSRGQTLLFPDGPRKLVTPITVLPDHDEDVDVGDRVRVELVVRGSQGRHFGRLTDVIERPRPLHVGVFRRAGRACFVEIEVALPPGPTMGRRRPKNDVIIDDADSMGAEDSALVQVELAPMARGRPSARMGRVVQILGRPGERDAELAKLIIDHGLDIEFPPEVEEEARGFGTEPRESDITGRRDARDLPLVTIDGETAKDFDDAVCAVRQGNGYTLYVAIADVAHYVTPGSALDKEARKRTTSTYLTDRAIPMLPEGLSNGLCSLKPKVDRLCMLAELTLDSTGHVRKSKFEPAVMRSQARLTYDRVAQALDGEPDEETKPLLPQLLVLARVASKLLERRLKRGAIDLDLPEPVLHFDDEGRPDTVKRRPRNDAHRLIEDLMLAANEAVARYFVERDLPGLFRVHENPDPERLATFVGLCEHLGLKATLSDAPRPDEIAHLLEKLSDHPFGKSLHSLLLRSLAQARYDEECLGHYGLAAEHYLHFTSPIRRYPDLVVHRVLKHVIAGRSPYSGSEPLQVVAEACSASERKAMKAERATLELDRAVIAERHVGEIFDATISGVQGFGLFCSLDDPYVDGLVPVQSLPSDYYELDDYGAMLVGQDTGRRYMMGDRLRVEIVNVSVARRQIELRLVMDEDEQSSDDQRRRTPKRADGDKRRGGRDDRPAGRKGAPKGPAKRSRATVGKQKPKGKPGSKPKPRGGRRR